MARTPEERLGKRVAALRASAQLSQAQLAERCDVVTETISRLERGSTVPSVARLADVAAGLGVELHELFHFKSRPSKKDEALERLLAVMRRRKTSDIEAITEIAERIFEEWG